MDKIVIMTDAPKGKSPLIESIRKLFPECEIQVVTNKDNGVAELLAVKSLETEKDGYENDENASG